MTRMILQYSSRYFVAKDGWSTQIETFTDRYAFQSKGYLEIAKAKADN
jgi:hypothetical protein